MPALKRLLDLDPDVPVLYRAALARCWELKQEAGAALDLSYRLDEAFMENPARADDQRFVTTAVILYLLAGRPARVLEVDPDSVDALLESIAQAYQDEDYPAALEAARSGQTAHPDRIEFERWESFLSDLARENGLQPELTTKLGHRISPYQQVAWDPQGRFLTYQAEAEEGAERPGHTVWQLDLVTGEERLLFDSGGTDLPHLELSPNGRSLLYVLETNEGKGRALHRLELASGEDVLLRSVEGVILHGVFAPDGQTIAVTDSAGLSVMNADGHNSKRGTTFMPVHCSTRHREDAGAGRRTV